MKFLNISPTHHGWGYGYGFFSNYRICLEQLIAFKESDIVPYINWKNTTWVEGFNPFDEKPYIDPNHTNPFDHWFDQFIPSEYDELLENVSGPRPDLIDHALHYFNDPRLNVQRICDKRNVIKPFIVSKIDEIFDKEFKEKTVLGVMARGTEYNYHHPMYGVFGINDYIKNIKEVLKKNPGMDKLFFVSEDSEYINALRNEFPNSYSMDNVFRRTVETMEYVNRVHCWPNVSTLRKDHCKLLGEETIIQTKLLSKCDHLFGRLSGILAGAVLWNEKIKKLHLI